MTPSAFLVVFCASMAAIAVARLAVADDSRTTDAGVASLTVGLTAFAGAWSTLQTAWFHRGGLVALAIGAVASGYGTVVLARCRRSSGAGAVSRSRLDGDCDGPDPG